MIMLFEARGLVFLGESVLQHEIFKEFACEAKDRPQKIELLEKNKSYVWKCYFYWHCVMWCNW